MMNNQIIKINKYNRLLYNIAKNTEKGLKMRQKNMKNPLKIGKVRVNNH
jgi:hypothetical protein